MSNKKKNNTLLKIIVIFVLIGVVFSIVVFVAPLRIDAKFWIAYCFAICSLVLQFFVLKLAFAKDGKARSRFYGIPIARIGLIYMIVQIVLSLVVMLLPAGFPAWISLCVFVILLCVAAIGLISADLVRTEVERQDNILSSETQCIIELRSKVSVLVGMLKDSDVNERLKQLSEEFKYSDPVSSEATETAEATLASMVSDLQNAVVENDTAAVLELCEKIRMTLAERNRVCKLNKRK